MEIQSSPEAGFERRIARYHSGLFWSYDQRVVTLVVFADLSEDWRPGEDLFRVADFASRLRVVRELLGASDAILFSVLPGELVFHAALGEDSARLAQRATAGVAALHELVQGPCELGSQLAAEASERLRLLETSPVDGALVLAERRSRDVAWGVALAPARREPGPTALELRFAHAVFRDLARLAQRRERGTPPAG